MIVSGKGSYGDLASSGSIAIGDDGALGGSAQGTVSVSFGGALSLSAADGIGIGTTGGTALIDVFGTGADLTIEPYLKLGNIPYPTSVTIGVANANVAGEISVQAGGHFGIVKDSAYLDAGTVVVSGSGSQFDALALDTDSGTSAQVEDEGLIAAAKIIIGGELTLSDGHVKATSAFSLSQGARAAGWGTVSAPEIVNDGLFTASGGSRCV
jgi:hypothetical protein